MKNPFTLAAYRVTSPYGYRNLNGKTTYHAGIDLVCDNRTVVSTDSGTVVASRIVTNKDNRTWEWGNYVCIETHEGIRVYFCHLASRAVKAGDKVKAGTIIGIMGNTGYSFGVHLHYEVRVNNNAINAAEYLGIKNQIGLATPSDESGENDPMTNDEKRDFIKLQNQVDALEKQFDAHTAIKYNAVDKDMPEWAHDDIQWLINNGYLRGSADGTLRLSYDLLRILCIMSRGMQDISADQLQLLDE